MWTVQISNIHNKTFVTCGPKGVTIIDHHCLSLRVHWKLMATERHQNDLKRQYVMYGFV